LGRAGQERWLRCVSAERSSQTELRNADDCLLKTPNSCSVRSATRRRQRRRQIEFNRRTRKRVIIKSKTCEKQTKIDQAKLGLSDFRFSLFYDRPHGVYLIGFVTISFDSHPHTPPLWSDFVAHAEEIALLIPKTNSPSWLACPINKCHYWFCRLYLFAWVALSNFISLCGGNSGLIHSITSFLLIIYRIDWDFVIGIDYTRFFFSLYLYIHLIFWGFRGVITTKM